MARGHFFRELFLLASPPPEKRRPTARAAVVNHRGSRRCASTGRACIQDAPIARYRPELRSAPNETAQNRSVHKRKEEMGGKATPLVVTSDTICAPNLRDPRGKNRAAAKKISRDTHSRKFTTDPRRHPHQERGKRREEGEEEAPTFIAPFLPSAMKNGEVCENDEKKNETTERRRRRRRRRAAKSESVEGAVDRGGKEKELDEVGKGVGYLTTASGVRRKIIFSGRNPRCASRIAYPIGISGAPRDRTEIPRCVHAPLRLPGIINFSCPRTDAHTLLALAVSLRPPAKMRKKCTASLFLFLSFSCSLAALAFFTVIVTEMIVGRLVDYSIGSRTRTTGEEERGLKYVRKVESAEGRVERKEREAEKRIRSEETGPSTREEGSSTEERENRVGEAPKLELIGGGRIAGTNAEGRPQRKRPSGDVTLIPPGRAYKMAAGVPFLPCYSYGVGFRLSRSLCLTRVVCMRGYGAAAVASSARAVSSLEETTTGWLAGWLAGWMGERRRVTSAEGIELSTEAEGATSKDKLPA
ncbi:hypothetical protein DBV15_05704 [Temnothorax longispinosus]|uniref:Uncharacterized protein n=1 Tax=Temnothorax longispinosus TaxID=300112 RepID=A0A4S2J9J4_9HYME|nr:hypothetical protein DBV15_05704 [Temnothorax longispinosus]